MKDCHWMTPNLACDGMTFYLPAQRLLVVVNVEGRRGKGFACGFTNESYQAWQALLRMRDIPFKEQIPLATWALKLILGAGVGTIAGILVGLVAFAFDGNRLWISSFGFLGFLDGCAWAVMQVLIAHSPIAVLRKTMSPEGYRWISYYCLLPLAGFLIGLKASFGGFGQGLIVGAANSLVFCWIAWSFWCAYRNRLRAELEGNQGDLTYSNQIMS